MFHRIYESMELGMHPAILYPRRSQSRPQLVYSSAPPLYAIGRDRVRYTARPPFVLKPALYGVRSK